MFDPDENVLNPYQSGLPISIEDIENNNKLSKSISRYGNQHLEKHEKCLSMFMLAFVVSDE